SSAGKSRTGSGRIRTGLCSRSRSFRGRQSENDRDRKATARAKKRVDRPKALSFNRLPLHAADVMATALSTCPGFIPNDLIALFDFTFREMAVRLLPHPDA